MPLTRYLGVKQKDARARLGQPEHVQIVDQARSILSDKMTAEADRKLSDQKKKHAAERKPMAEAVKKLRAEHREQREELKQRHENRQAKETLARANRIRKGIMGMFDRVALKIGRGKLHRQFVAEIEQQAVRDAGEFNTLKVDQLMQRRQLQKSIKLLHEKHRRERQQTRVILGHWLGTMTGSEREAVKAHLKEQGETKKRYMKQREGKGRSSKRGLSLKPKP